MTFYDFLKLVLKTVTKTKSIDKLSDRKTASPKDPSLILHCDVIARGNKSLSFDLHLLVHPQSVYKAP